MELLNKEVDVYELVSELCKRFFDKHTPEQHPYLPRKDNSGLLKKLRARAFEILLKKSTQNYEDDHQDTDPVVELLKYAFVLKTSVRRISKAKDLEHLLDTLIEDGANLDPSVYSTLQFLNGLKSLELKDENALNVFHYGKVNPLLPEEVQNPKEVPRYQVYPTESFVLPERFEAMLGIEKNFSITDNTRDPLSRLSFRSQYRSATTIGIETLRSESEGTIGSILSVPKYSVRLVSTRDFSTASYFLPGITEDDNERRDEFSSFHLGQLPGMESPWLCVKSARTDVESDSETSEIQSVTNEEVSESSALILWEDVAHLPDIPEHRTWESLGHSDAPKEPPFVTESSQAILYLDKIRNAGYLHLLSNNDLDLVNVVPAKDCLQNIKLLLLGIESETFNWDEKQGFTLRRNTTIPGLSAQALLSACSDVMYWGACYRSLSLLIKPDPHTGKMRQDGLMFRAMCNSVKELLVYYQAVILRISVENDTEAPTVLKLLLNVRPMASLIAEVARLCGCDRENKSTLGEGLGLLSHIYDEVTRVTKPSVALVFYSILKSCCEVYFRLLQRWLFEGVCDDAYGEFMIKVRPQYLREKSHRFWTKGFAVNPNSVPGFLSHLAEPILDCGKTVKLLKTCDPKNPLCSIFASSHPTVRVCLSVGMVREQEIRCRDFLLAGENLLGQNTSFSFAFEEQRVAEKERADLVVKAQRETLLRLQRERREAEKEVARNKRELLAQLKDQAEEVASRKEREREAELQKDKQLLEEFNVAEEMAKNAELAEKKIVLNYYNELAAEVERRRVRAEWRVKRMKLFERRVDSLSRAKRELWGIEESDLGETSSPVSPLDEDGKDSSKPVDEVDENLGDSEKPEVVIEESKHQEIEDENKNPTELKIVEVTKLEDKNSLEETPEVEVKKIAVRKVDTVEELPKKSSRSCVLDINRTRMMSGSGLANLNECRETLTATKTNTEPLLNRPKDLQLITTDNAAAARKNKLKVLEQEFGMTPNNNELNIIVMDAQGNENTICIDTATVNPDNIRAMAEINKNLAVDNLTDAQKNRNRNLSHYHEELDEFLMPHRVQGSVNLTDAQKNRKRNMSRTEDLPDRDTHKVNFADYADLQRNRAKVMGHDHRNYQDYVPEETEYGANCPELLTPLSQPPHDDGVTPMSCTTDTFPLSMSSSLTQFQNCEEDFCPSAMRSSATPASLDPDSAADPLESRPNTSFSLPGGAQSFPNFFGLEAAATPTFKSTLTVADVEMIDNTSLQVYLEKSVMIPLKIQSRLANAAVIKYMLNEQKMLSHLHSLRSFFFLLNGEFAKSLTGQLYKRLYEISVPLELFRSATLTNILENALNSSLSSSYTNSQLLTLSATDIPTQLEVSNPEFLNCLCLNYKISWPLNIVLDERVMQQYSKVFKFLLMVGRVLYVLQGDFHLLKIERKAATSDQYHKLQLYRHSMMQFVTALHNYLTCSVLHASWAEFEKDLEHATTMDQICTTHVTYIKKILSRCMLTARGEKMRNFLCNIFKVILKFHNRVRSQNWSSNGAGYTHANFARLEQMYETFCEARTYLAHVANKLASSGYQPHLTHFLNTLNINPLYDLTDMASSKKS